MTKSLTLDLGERVAAVRILNEFKGGLDTLAVLLDDIKKVAVTEDEWKEANLIKVPNPDNTETWKWDEGHTKEMDLDDKTVAYLVSKIDEKSAANEVTLSDVALISLKEKLA